jgi:surfeit locus 1 family protein
MRKLHFKPMPGLSVVLAISLAILIGLGVWQYQRLQWKTALLAEVEASVTAPPLESLSELSEAIAQGAPVDFRRIQFRATQDSKPVQFHLYKPLKGGIYWDVFEPFADRGVTVLANLITIEGGAKEAVIQKEPQANIPLYAGYVRKAYPMGRVESWVKSKPNVDTNRYFHFNQTGDWYDGLSGGVVEGYYIDIETSSGNADGLPIRRPDIANNHFDYMLTWWSFALIFLVIYLILHKRAGRLKFK